MGSLSSALSGGVQPNVDVSQVKYTLNAERVAWVKNVYPLLNSLLGVTSQVSASINLFTYSGPLTLIRHAIIPEEDVSRIDVSGYTLATTVEVPADETTYYAYFVDFVSVPVQTAAPASSKLMGGIVYELLNDSHLPGLLYNYTDPTGDIDVDVRMPVLDASSLKAVRAQLGATPTSPGKIEYDIDVSVPFITPEGVNPVYRQLMTMIHTQLVSLIAGLPDVHNSEYLDTFDIKQYSAMAGQSAAAGFAVDRIGKVYIVTVVEGMEWGVNLLELPADSLVSQVAGPSSVSMIKVQLVVSAGGTIDHLVEFVILPTLINNKQPDTQFMVLRTPDNAAIRTQNVFELFKDNMSALETRQQFVTALPYEGRGLPDVALAYLHKGLNHVNRLLYLFELLKHVREVDTLDSVSEGLGTFIANYARTFKGSNLRLPFYKREGTRVLRTDLNLPFVVNAYEDLWQYVNGGRVKRYGEKPMLTTLWPTKVPKYDFVLQTNLKGNVEYYIDNEAHQNLLALVHANVREVKALKNVRDQTFALIQLRRLLASRLMKFKSR